MSAIQFEVPEEVLISLKETPDSLSRELPILAAVKLFELGKLSSGRAAQLAGLSRVEFLSVLGRYQVSPFPTDPEELKRDVEHA
jgi:predicted HTH domain antitoxin